MNATTRIDAVATSGQRTGSRTTRHARTAGIVATAAATIGVLGACAPDPGASVEPPAPSVTAELTITPETDTTRPSVVWLTTTATGFPGTSSDGFDMTYELRDTSSGRVVRTATDAHGNSDGVFVLMSEVDQFEPTYNDDGTVSITAAITITAERNGESASDTDEAVLTFTPATDAITGSFVSSGYQAGRSLNPVCSGVGTIINVTVTGELSNLAGGFSRYAAMPYGSGLRGFTAAPDGESATLSLTSTTACWTLDIWRASFAGGLSGTTNYEVLWGLPVG